jgi:carbon storage regulator
MPVANGGNPSAVLDRAMAVLKAHSAIRRFAVLVDLRRARLQNRLNFQPPDVVLGFESPAHHQRGRSPMLVLTRKIGEQITIGESIQVTVIAIRGKRVRIGLAAPHQISIQRDDIASGPPALAGSRCGRERKSKQMPRA